MSQTGKPKMSDPISDPTHDKLNRPGPSENLQRTTNLDPTAALLESAPSAKSSDDPPSTGNDAAPSNLNTLTAQISNPFSGISGYQDTMLDQEARHTFEPEVSPRNFLVLTWGDNNFGQCMQPAEDKRNVTRPILIKQVGITTSSPISIAAGFTLSLALGQKKCFGAGDKLKFASCIECKYIHIAD